LDRWRGVENDDAILNAGHTPLSEPRHVDNGFRDFIESSSGEINTPARRADNAALLNQCVDSALTNLKCKRPTRFESDSITRQQCNLPARGVDLAKIPNLRSNKRQCAAILEINLPSINHRCCAISLKQ
jgi:hypothetical protein